MPQPAGPIAFDGVCIVVPAYNEATALGAVLDDLCRFVPARQVVVVDDCSRDDTADVARGRGAVVLRHAINRGQGAALATGLKAAIRMGASVIVTFDADGQHSADDLPALIAPILAGDAQVVLGTRFYPGSSVAMPRARRLVLRAGIVFTRLVSRIKVTDTHNGLRALSAHAARVIRIRHDRMEHASEILDEIRRHGLRFVEQPVHVRYSAYSLEKGQKSLDAVGLALRIVLGKMGR